MVSDGQLRVGMKFGTVKSAVEQVAKTEKKLGGKITSKNAGTVGSFSGEKSGNQVNFSNNGKLITYHATIDGKHYSGLVHNANIKSNDEIMHKRFTRMTNEEGTQYAVDKNNNGIIDEGEIQDCIWPDKY